MSDSQLVADQAKTQHAELLAEVKKYGASVDSLNSLRTMTNTMDGYVNELEDKNGTLLNGKNDNLRNAQINTYAIKRYNAHTRVISTFTAFCVCAIVILAVRNMGYIGSDTANLGISGLLVVGGIVMVYQIVDLAMRDNMDYDAYAWGTSTANQSPTVYEYNKAQFGKLSGTDLSAFGISTCADASCCGDGMQFDRKAGKCVIKETSMSSPELFTTIEESIHQRIPMGGKRTFDTVSLPLPQTNVTPLSTHTDCVSCVDYM
jgi:hypothetical protein